MANGPQNPASPESEQSLTTGRLWKKLLQMAGPMLVGLVSVMSISLVDTYFVGQLGTLPLAAMSYSFPVIFFVGGITMGLSAATSSVVSRAVGASGRDKARTVTTHALLLTTGLVTTALVIGFPIITRIFELLGASADVLPLIMDYMTVWLFGMFFFVGPVIGTASLRARGDAKTPMYIMVGVTVLNFALDPLLIFGAGPIPALGVVGAALASAIARAIATFTVIAILWDRDHLLSFRDARFFRVRSSWMELSRIAAPAAATNVVVPVTTAILTRMVSEYGEPAVAAYGAGSRIESFAMLIPMALGSGLSPIAGQNWGAGLGRRVRKVLDISLVISVSWGVLTWSVFLAAGDAIAGWFIDGQRAVDYLTLFLWIVPFGQAFQGLFVCCNSTLNAIDYPFHAGALSITRTLVLTAPLAWIGAHVWGIDGIFASIATANVVVGLSAVWITLAIVRRRCNGSARTD